VANPEEPRAQGSELVATAAAAIQLVLSELPQLFLESARGAVQAVADAYDGEIADIFLGSPEEARAWHALREQGDAEHFLRVFGGPEFAGLVLGPTAQNVRELVAEALTGEAELLDDPVPDRPPLTGAPGERDDDTPFFDDMTGPELQAWAAEAQPAAQLLADYIRERDGAQSLFDAMRGIERNDPAQVSALADLTPADLFMFARVAERAKGHAGARKAEWRRVEYGRRRAERRRSKFS
jgi:hypothetical protein